MYSAIGRPSIPPERLLKSMVLMALYSVRSERLLCEQLGYNLLFRWFLDMDMVEPAPDQRGTPATSSASASVNASRRSSAGPRPSPTSVARASEALRVRSSPPSSWAPLTTCFEWPSSYPSLRARSARFGRGRPRAGGEAAEHGRGWAPHSLAESLKSYSSPPQTAVYHQPASAAPSNWNQRFKGGDALANSRERVRGLGEAQGNRLVHRRLAKRGGRLGPLSAAQRRCTRRIAVAITAARQASDRRTPTTRRAP
jgi:Transposase domain (DUF772)